MINGIKIEICCGGYEDCLTALKYPIDRIELNSALELGGLTPTIATLRNIKKITDIPICCMVRNRGGDFNYSDKEFELMYEEGQILLENGADGLVFGFLTDNNEVDKEKTYKMTELAHKYSKQAIFHKAFDETNMLAEINNLISLGIDRILTSGGLNYPDIMKGANILKKLNDEYSKQIEILPGGGVRKENIVSLLEKTGIKQVHMSASIIKKGFKQVDESKLSDILQCLNNL